MKYNTQKGTIVSTPIQKTLHDNKPENMTNAIMAKNTTHNTTHATYQH